MCKQCKLNPVITFPSNNIKLCKSCFIRYFEKKVRKTIRQYSLIEKNDKILVACSGGKDSTTLIYILHNLPIKMKIEAITVDSLIGDYTRKNIKNLEEFCRKNKIKLHTISFKEEFGSSLCYMMAKLKAKDKKCNSCSVCGVLRRYIINKKARELKFNKVATGHNLDDEAQSFLMNVFKNDMKVTARLGPKTGIIKTKYFIPRIKPLYFLTENETTIYSKVKDFKINYEKCPCSENVFRREIETVLNKLEKNHPQIKYSIVNSFLEILPVIKEKYKTTQEIKICKKCKEPSSSPICNTCKILERIK